jgi:hypothetical protein
LFSQPIAPHTEEHVRRAEPWKIAEIDTIVTPHRKIAICTLLKENQWLCLSAR